MLHPTSKWLASGTSSAGSPASPVNVNSSWGRLRSRRLMAPAYVAWVLLAANLSYAKDLTHTYKGVIVGAGGGGLFVKLDDSNTAKKVVMDPRQTVVAYSGQADRKLMRRHMVVQFRAELENENERKVISKIEIVGFGAREPTTIREIGIRGGNRVVSVKAPIKGVSRAGEMIIQSREGRKKVSHRYRMPDVVPIEFQEFPGLQFLKQGDQVELIGSIFRRRVVRGNLLIDEMHHGIIAATRISVTASQRPVNIGRVELNGFANRMENRIVGN